MKTAALALATVGSLALGSLSTAEASTVDFTIDTGASSVSLTPTSCIGTCSLTASVASGLGGTYSLGEGDSATVDFLTFAAGSGVGFGVYDIEATLAFSGPLGATATVSGAVAALNGIETILLGGLSWDDATTVITLANGTEILMEFEQGFVALTDSVTTSATFTVLSIVPLPGASMMLGGGLVLLPLVARRRRRKAA
ncbi:hypothetical protein [Actibacterium lipolyticum]|uniref:VPLPA-CTERM protein sorting domain-containing protein n=1 Tax=Actibacterium lipolyticum TaxID=1524263 RepID=A0A238JLJ4_9RHOB|nr:hypothetical protein [Actibacterium lipolyticum]SMX31539.1 hypothetical protein COL8621_00500 [Actibacterium lipolyticum]